MNITCTAVYEHGVLRPQQPLNLPDGAEVEVLVVAKQGNQPLPSADAAREMILKIAALPIEGKTDPFSGCDHDDVLYPKEGKMP